MAAQPAPLENRPNLRQRIAIALFLTIGTAIVLAQWVISAWSSPQVGWDFPVFYIAGRMPMHLLYSPAAFANFWRENLAPIGVPHWAPYVRPAVFSFLLHPIAALPYYHALWLWLAGGLTAYLAAAGLLIRRFRLPGFLLPVYACFFPAIAGIIGGADVGFLFLAFVIAFLLLEQRRDVLAAILLTACLCKFNLVFLVPVALLLHRRYRALASFALGAVCVAASSIWLTPIREYIEAAENAPKIAGGFYPVGLRGFSTAIGQPWCYPILAAAALALCCWLMKRLPFMEAFCVAIVGALLISPYVTWYDSTLLGLPLALAFTRSTTAVRIACAAVLAAVPLWRHGGGNNGPIGFMHVGVEILVIAYFTATATGLRLKFGFERASKSSATEA